MSYSGIGWRRSEQSAARWKSLEGRLHFFGATLEPLDIGVFGLIMAQRSVSGSPAGSPAAIAKLLEFAVQHDITPVVETFKFARINGVLAYLKSGKARYRIALER